LQTNKQTKELNRYRARCVYLQNMWLPEDDCNLQPKRVEALKLIVHLA